MMTNAEITFIVVEDNQDYQAEVLNQLAKAEFSPENHLGTAATYDDAKELLEQYADDLDVVFLDLNIPRNDADPKPEDKHGTALLDLIHESLNKRPGVYIRVIIVSGQDLAANEAMKSVMMNHYSSTLVGVVEKSAMVQMLKANLKRLRQDPILKALRRLEIPLESEWETLIDTSRPALDRLSAGRAIAIRLAQNEIDYREGREHSHPEFDDNLGSIYHHLLNRFRSGDTDERIKVSMGSITSHGKWGCFLWRGILMDHFRTINSYWNAYKHLAERPYHNPTSDADDWSIPAPLMQRGRDGEVVVHLIELAVRDLLEWYLPWHEQVLAKIESER
jgi:CheY-like chemotaxis protein